MLEGSSDSKILIISDYLRVTEFANKEVLSAERKEVIVNALSRAGINLNDVSFTVIHPRSTPGYKEAKHLDAETRASDINNFKQLLNSHKANVLVPLGSYALELLTGLDNIFKQHCSILTSLAEFGGRKVLPMLHPEYVARAYSDRVYISVGCLKLKEQMQFPELRIPERKMLVSLDLSYEEIISYLETKVKTASMLSCDVETGRGVINTVGFAISETEGIAIQTDLNTQWAKDPEKFYNLWKLIAEIWSSDIPKIAQNALFEQQWAFKYGIMLRNVIHDTQWAMKFLHPELEKGLDNVGRIYTDFPYWKDDHSDWNNIRNWRDHLTYNVKDTTGQFQGYLRQKKALEDRKLDKLFYQFVMKFYPLTVEMSLRGMTLDEERLFSLRREIQARADNCLADFQDNCSRRLGREVNVRSPKQLKTALKELGIKIPTTKGKESTDKKALVKLRRKYPDEPILSSLIELSKLNKQLSSYLNFNYDEDKQVRFSIDGCATETGRWASYLDPFGNGFNAQTIPKFARKFIKAPEGKLFIQVDLQQAESRFVGYEAPEPTLIRMLETKQDVHKYVAAKIFNKAEELIKPNERQLGKKSGHSANYGVGPRTFAEACLVEMGIVLTEHEAKRIIEGYYEALPGIKRRHMNIQAQIRRTRMLKTPMGRERIFYGRMGDEIFREAYAYCPQSTIPDITNCLMLFLYDSFEDLEFVLQCHDSLLLQFDKERIDEVIKAAYDYSAWHPEIHLPGGRLVIPIDVEVGTHWGTLEKI